MDSSSKSRERGQAARRKKERRAAQRGAGKRAREEAAEQKEGDHEKQRSSRGTGDKEPASQKKHAFGIVRRGAPCPTGEHDRIHGRPKPPKQAETDKTCS